MSLKHSKDLCPLLGILMEHFNFLFVILQKKKKVLLGWGGVRFINLLVLC